MNRAHFAVLAGIAVIALGACSQMSMKPVADLKDNELALPADYKSWPKFLTDVQRSDAKQIRDIYVNPTGAKAVAGQPFPNGSVMVMEVYPAKARADGTPETGADGKMLKGNLAKVFVMGKEAGWGKLAPSGLGNGDWIYSGFLADGKTLSPADPPTVCRGCHLPLSAKDFVPRYDEYFQKRGAALTNAGRIAMLGPWIETGHAGR